METQNRQIPSSRGLRRLAAGLAALGLLVLVTACGTPAKIQVSAPSGTAGGGLADGITVLGTGKVKGTPDTLGVSIGITTKRPSVSAAVADNAVTTGAVTNALKAKGVAAKDVQTTNYTVLPSFSFTNNRQTVDGYIVNNTVTVKIHDIPGAGAIIDAATSAGGNDAMVQGVSFSLVDNKALLNQARDEAYADAKSKATQLARLSGRNLGPAQAITETVAPNAVSTTRQMLTATAGAQTPISPGEVSTDVTINVRYSLG